MKVLMICMVVFISSAVAVSPCTVENKYPFQSGQIFEECTREQSRSTFPQQFGNAFRACNVEETTGPQTCSAVPFLFDCGFDECGASSRVYFSGGITNPPRESNAPAYVARGRSYKFLNYAGASHPMAIHRNLQTLSSTDRYDVGVTNQGSVLPTTPLSITLDAGAPDALAYQCEIHQSMSGFIEVGDAVMDPFQQTGNVLGSATGAISCTVNTMTNTVSWNIRWNGIPTVTAMHFHAPGLANVDAAVIIDVGTQCSSGANANPCIVNDYVESPANIAHLLSGQAYINLHTAAYPGGEIRTNVVCRDFTNGPITTAPTPAPVPSSASTFTITLFLVVALMFSVL